MCVCAGGGHSVARGQNRLSGQKGRFGPPLRFLVYHARILVPTPEIAPTQRAQSGGGLGTKIRIETKKLDSAGVPTFYTRGELLALVGSVGRGGCWAPPGKFIFGESVQVVYIFITNN